MIISNQPIAGAEPMMCTENVRKRIRACGGRAVYGWHVKNRGDYLFKGAHCVWQNDEGELFDVTPYFVEAHGELGIADWPETIEFEPDPKCEWGEGRCTIPSQYVAVDPRWKEACRLMTIADTFLNSDNPDLAKCRYWTERANTALRRCGIRGRGWDTPTSLAMEDIINCCL